MNSMWKLLGDGLKLVAGLLESDKPEAVAVARSVVDSLIQGHDGTLSVADVDAALTSLREALAKNDNDALQALLAKFKT